MCGRCIQSTAWRAGSTTRSRSVAVRQLKASIVCTREWSSYLLDREASPERVRSVLRVNERVFRRCLTDIAFKGLTRSLGIDPFAAVLVDHDTLPSRFKQVRYPQMLVQLDTARERKTQRGLPDEDLPTRPLDVNETLQAHQRETAESLELGDDLDIDR